MCLICKNDTKTFICTRCSKNPFKVETVRQILADQNRLLELQKTYNGHFAEIVDINKGKFWDKRYKDKTSLKKQDGMTKDRINITSNLIPKNINRILDIGVGKGFIEELIVNRDIEIWGNDISRSSIEYMNKKFRGNFRLESIYKMKYAKGYFDAVLALEVFEHIPPGKILNVVKDIKSILKKRGYLIVSVPTNEGLENMKDNPNGHVRMYTIPLISKELELAGFRIVKIETLYAFNKYYLLKKLIAKFVKRWKINNIIISAQSL